MIDITAAARLAIRAELHRRRTGAYPASREDFPAHIREVWPVDPFNGDPVRYMLRDGEPRIFAVGADRDNDGGQRYRGHFSPESWIRPWHWEHELESNPDAREEHNGDWVILPPCEPYPHR